MYVVRFSNYRVTEFADPRTFQAQVGKWMEIREGENSYLLGHLPLIVAAARANGTCKERLFALHDGDNIVAAAILFARGCLVHTWATPDMLDPLVDGLAGARCNLNAVFGPASISWQLARRICARNNSRLESGRAERVYQLTRVTYEPPADGRLELAVDADLPMLRDWVNGFVREAHYEVPDTGTERTLRDLLKDRVLYLWKQPHPVSMAAWTAPTARGGSINFVYTPPKLRGNGHAKAVVAALARHMLAGGRSYCFILTDTDDTGTNSLYQALGAHTLCELLRCTIHPQAATPPMSTTTPRKC